MLSRREPKHRSGITTCDRSCRPHTDSREQAILAVRTGEQTRADNSRLSRQNRERLGLTQEVWRLVTTAGNTDTSGELYA